MKPCRTKVTVSKPRCGCCGEARDGAAVVHAPAVGAREVHADVAGLERRGRAHVLVGLGVAVEVVHAEQERVDRRPLEAERDGLQHGVGHEGRLRPVDALELARRLGGPEGRPGSARVTPGRDGGGLPDGERRRRPVERVTYPSRPPGLGLAVRPVARCEVVGVDEAVPVLDGRFVPYVNLDNAASTPPLRSVLDAVERFLPYYASVHRGTGYKSRVSTAAYEQARDMVRDFVGADPDGDVVVFGKNTTEAINTLARSMPMAEDAVVLTTVLEHHSNDLPWRSRAEVVHVRARADGTLDEDDLDRHLRAFAGRIALLAVSGASNVTGVVQPVHRLAEKVHAVGGRHPRRCRPARGAPGRRHGRPRRPRSSGLRRPLGPQDVRAVRHGRAGRGPIVLRTGRQPSRWWHGRGGVGGRRRLGRPTRPGGGRQPERGRRRRPRRGDAGAGDLRPRPDPRPRGRADPVRRRAAGLRAGADPARASLRAGRRPTG